jgi:hypothetical protein
VLFSSWRRQLKKWSQRSFTIKGRSSSRSFSRRLSVEMLENRTVLSGFGFSTFDAVDNYGSDSFLPAESAVSSLAVGDLVVLDTTDTGNPGTPTPLNRIIKVDPVSGVQTSIALDGLLANPYRPSAVAVERIGDRWGKHFGVGGRKGRVASRPNRADQS